MATQTIDQTNKLQQRASIQGLILRHCGKKVCSLLRSEFEPIHHWAAEERSCETQQVTRVLLAVSSQAWKFYQLGQHTNRIDFFNVT